MTVRQELFIEELIDTRNAQDAQIERLRSALAAALAYLSVLEHRIPPSNPGYWPTVDVFRNAMDDLQPGDVA